MEKIKAEAEKGSDSDSDSSSGSSSVSKSSFGCQSEQSSGAPRKRARTAKAKAAPKKGAGSAAASSRKSSGKGKDKEKEKESAKVLAKEAQLLESSGKILTLLEELSCSAIWRSAVRATEVDRRLGRVVPLCSEVEDLVKEVAGEERQGKLMEMRSKLEGEHKRVTALKEMCKIIRAGSSEEIIEDISASGGILCHYTNCYMSVMEAEGALVEMVQILAKKLLDVSWIASGLSYPS